METNEENPYPMSCYTKPFGENDGRFIGMYSFPQVKLESGEEDSQGNPCVFS